MKIYTADKIIEKGFIKIHREKIIDLGLMNHLIKEDGYRIIDMPAHYAAIPGLIDLHIHGVNGSDVMDGTVEALANITETLPSEGTTSFLATTITQSVEAIENAVKNAGSYIEKQSPSGKAEILGLHLEGPFINPKRAGAQPEKYIVDPDLNLLKRWQTLSKNHVKLVTLAPEQQGGMQMVDYLIRNGITASIGHSDATYNETIEAIEAGVSHVTHLFNQMKGLHHREPGVVGAALLREDVKAELIVDGIHVRPEIVQLAYKQKGKDGIVLITDSMRAKCLKSGSYDLGGQEVIVTNGKAVLKDGTLAGSVLKLGNALKNMISYTGCSLQDAIRMAAVNPAKQIKIFDRKGSLEIGKDADIVILDEQLDIVMTFTRGKLAFQKEGFVF